MTQLAPTRVPVERRVLVLGGAPEAVTACRELATLGYQVSWVPGVDWVPPEPVDVAGVTLYAGCDLSRVDGHVGAFTAYLSPNGGAAPQALSVAAIVIATGNQRIFPADDYGLRPGGRVVSVSSLRAQLCDRTRAPSPQLRRRVFFVLDLAGETSKETATEALETARDLHAIRLDEVYVFYRNLKVDTWNLDRLTRDMRQAGIVFCRYDRPDIEVDEGGVRFTYEEGTLPADLLVLPEMVSPREDNVDLADILDIRLGEDGSFQDVNVRHYRPGTASRKGIYLAGRCHMDADAATLDDDARQAAAAVDELLRKGYLEPEETIAHVDSELCIRCLTCIRSCPHAAVELARYEEVTAARVVDLACRGCGACVANCPVEAIEMVGLAMPAWAARGSGGRLAP